jgi:hypothetical protein
MLLFAWDKLPSCSIWIAKAIVPIATFESWEAWPLPILDPSEECFVGFLDSKNDILQNVRSDILVLGSNVRLDINEVPFLFKVAD